MVTISPLATYTRISPNKTSPRNHHIDRITPHCVVGQWTSKQIADYFSKNGLKASPNYGIGKDGDISCSVDEKDRSWCSSSAANDHRAITMEIASDTTDPYTMTDKAYNALIDLCVDICKRYDRDTLLYFGDKDKALAYEPKENEMQITVHRYFARKSCPGDWLFSRLDKVAEEVTKRLQAKKTPIKPSITTPSIPKPATPGTSGTASKTPTKPVFQKYRVRTTANNLRIRKGPGTNTSTVGSFKSRSDVYIMEEAFGPGATKWGKLEDGRGWISLDYVVKYK